MPARADVPYNSTPTVNPEETGGGQPFSVRSNANDFGGQIGAATQEAGKTLGEAADQQYNFQLKQQGLLNEAAATDGETQYEIQKDKIVQGFKTLQGFAATPDSPAYQKSIADISALRQQMIGTMRSPNAAKAFNTLSLRHEANGIDDINSYATQQVKATSNTAATAQMNQAVSRASSYDVAASDSRFGDIAHDVDFSLGITMANQGYDVGTGMKSDPNTGKLSFDTSTEKGQQAQAVYQNYRDKAVGQAWQNRIEALTNDTSDPSQGGAIKANVIYQANKSDIPADAQVKISGFLVAKVRNAQTRSYADQDTADLEHGYQATISGSLPSYPNNNGNVKNASGTGFLNPATPVDGVIATTNNLRSDIYKGKTLAQIGATWEGTTPQHIHDWVNNVSKASGIDPNAVPNRDDPAVLHALVKGITIAEKSAQDRGAFSDDVINQGVQGSLGGQKANLLVAGNQTVAAPANPVSKADWYRQNFAPIMQQAQDRATKLFPDDPVAQDQYISRRQTNIQREITAQDMAYTADIHTVQGALVTPMGDGTLPTTPDQLSPEAKEAYTRSQIQNPGAAMGMDRVMSSNAKGQAAGYGSNFYSFLQRVIAPQGDPTRITDPNELAKSVYGGEDGPLTNTGLRELQGIIGQRGTPQGEAVAAQMTSFLKQAHTMISGQTASIADPKGEKMYGDFLKHAIPQIVAAERSGNAASMFDRKGDLYNSITNFMRPTQTQANDYIYRTDVKAADAWESQAQGMKLTDPAIRTQALNSLVTLVKQGKVPKPQAQALALRYNLVAPNPPPVPRPNDQ